ncbi:hypothetical protein IV37_GL000207 [Fructilactobacillus fructivorans]|uniref:hypothetical protein n=1 Tax=Fructilactobacillus fructivorans TaxID=1614 RepID=UPI00070509F5|nr:hypothetical protein [Fructilactobacillus fructivorans]KRN13484.1 hypothetical protein IV37_GL000207 [Fructilactobacillus fructivorans]
MSISESRKRANEKWNKKHRKRIQYLNKRSTAKNFIKSETDMETLNEFEELIRNRKEEIDMINEVTYNEDISLADGVEKELKDLLPKELEAVKNAGQDNSKYFVVKTGNFYRSKNAYDESIKSISKDEFNKLKENHQKMNDALSQSEEPITNNWDAK